MKKPLLILITFLAGSIGLSASDVIRINSTSTPTPSIDPAYEVVSIVAIGNKKPKVGIIRIEDKRRYNVSIGDELDAYTVEGIKTLGKEQFVIVTKDGSKRLIALKRPADSPFNDGPLFESYSKQLIDTNGRLTEKGKKAITNNLRQVASAGQQYILEEGASEVNYKKLVGDYFKGITPIAGEDYTKLTVSENGGKLNMPTLFGDVVIYQY